MYKTLFVAVFVLLVFFAPDITNAQDSGFVTCTGPDCSACKLVDMANNGIIFLFGLIGIIFAILMTVAGFGLVTSAGNQSALNAAKSKFTNAIIGLIIVMAAWLMVDTIMRSLLTGEGNLGVTFEGFGPWSQVVCQKMAETIEPSPDSTAPITGTYGFQAFSLDKTNQCRMGHSGSYADLATCESAALGLKATNPDVYITKTCDDKTVTVLPPTWSDLPLCGAPADPTADGKFTYQAGIALQAAHASAPLQAMLTCMANIVPGNVGEISSISDSLITSGAKTWAQCRLGGCAHTKTSFHYGNSGKCGDQSFAVDFGDEWNAVVLCKAANSCGTVKNCSVHNGNHVHLELPCP